ncbi:NERD domain-containing protein [Balneola vulgaris]|uniref:NERD domain-containing protein n=1 Tax=Balneola vulgaris TaxID=287535 RepID=UPI000372A318|nr:ATP-binding domain-containing protein [Balneola vulgaris]
MIYPEFFPDERKSEVAESKVFSMLKKVSHKYDIYYSKKFVTTGKSKRAEYEIDFIIVIPEKVLFCLEVKGGIVNYSGFNDKWTQNGRQLIKRPDQQASSAMHSLISEYSSIIGNMAIGWGLCFPDCELEQAKLSPIVNERQIIDQRKLLYIEDSIADCLSFVQEKNSSRRGCKRWEYEKFKSELLRDIGFVQILSTKMKYDENRFIQLTNDQIRIFDRIKSNQKIITDGPAGSGKTIIAKTVASDLLGSGKKVLFLCYNRTLANKVRYGFDRDEPNIQVSTFHSLAKSIIEQSDLKWWETHCKEDNFWELLVPIKLEECIYFFNEKYDCIIIDEGQDFKELWFELIFSLSSNKGSIYIFIDKMQNIFGRNFAIPGEDEFLKYTLPENCRNTKSIVKHLSNVLETPISSFPNSPIGQSVEFKSFESVKNQQKFLESELIRLINEQKVETSQILLLLNSSKNKSSIKDLNKVLRYKVLSLDNKARFLSNTIHYTTINTFKGLEADIVFILDIDKIPQEYKKEILYTESSRARHKLYICQS